MRVNLSKGFSSRYPPNLHPQLCQMIYFADKANQEPQLMMKAIVDQQVEISSRLRAILLDKKLDSSCRERNAIDDDIQELSANVEILDVIRRSIALNDKVNPVTIMGLRADVGLLQLVGSIAATTAATLYNAAMGGGAA